MGFGVGSPPGTAALSSGVPEAALSLNGRSSPSEITEWMGPLVRRPSVVGPVGLCTLRRLASDKANLTVAYLNLRVYESSPYSSCQFHQTYGGLFG
jgi:hypothetical protein